MRKEIKTYLKPGDRVRAIKKTIYDGFETIRKSEGYDLKNQVGIVQRVRIESPTVLVEFPKISGEFGWEFHMNDLRLLSEEPFLSKEDFLI